jgi:hypothetical protein
MSECRFLAVDVMGLWLCGMWIETCFSTWRRNLLELLQELLDYSYWRDVCVPSALLDAFAFFSRAQSAPGRVDCAAIDFLLNAMESRLSVVVVCVCLQ